MAYFTNRPISTTFVFEGVKPESTNGRFFNTEYDKTTGKLQIKEFFQRTYNAKNPLPPVLLDVNNVKYRYIHMPASFRVRKIIDRPLCIGCWGDFLLFQFMSTDSLYVSFFTLDLKTASVCCFEDTEQCFRRNVSTEGALRGIVCPDKKTLLIRSSPVLLWKMQQAKIIQVDFKQFSSTKNEFGTKSSGLEDNSYSAMAAHPKKPCVIFIAAVDDMHFLCDFLIHDMSSGKTILKRKHRLDTLLPLEMSTQLKVGDKFYSEFFCTSLVFSRDGDFVILACLVQPSGGYPAPQVKAFMYDTDNLDLIKDYLSPVSVDGFPVPTHRSNGRLTLVTVLSPCQDHFSACLFRENSDYFRTLCVFEIPRAL